MPLPDRFGAEPFTGVDRDRHAGRVDPIEGFSMIGDRIARLCPRDVEATHASPGVRDRELRHLECLPGRV